MAILNTNEIMFTAFEPKVQNRFIMYIDGIPAFLVKKISRPNVQFGDSDNLIIGEWVIALGNPLGLFDISNKPTATVGILSGKGMDCWSFLHCLCSFIQRLYNSII